MCGIAGVMTRDGNPPDEGFLKQLSDAMVHRGPDGNGRHVSGNVGLVQTRLAIIDLETGSQPLFADKKGNKVALVANGEIYNYVELKAEMEGVSFSSRSDCELPLQLYLRHGIDFVEHLRGMYTIAIHDTEEKKLILSRDPFGIKPLYYVENADGFAFASEAAALMAAGLVTPRVQAQPRNELLQLQFTTGAQTVYSEVKRLLPGETIVISDGRITETRVRKALPERGPVRTSEADALKRLDKVLTDAIGIHQRSDVPYGMFFSGGVDSSVLLAMMARLNERPVKALTAGFDSESVADERDHARAVAQSVGADHLEVSFGEGDFWTLLPSIAAAMDDPTADYAVLPTYKLAARARSEGLKVVLSGEGGDEMFAGYARYRHAARPWPFTRAMRRRGIFNGLGILKDDGVEWRQGISSAGKAIDLPERSRLQVAQAADCRDWLPNDLLNKLDRCLMAHGVEGRVPFLDPLLADFAFSLPDNLKIRKKSGKWLLRTWLAGALPVSEPFSRKRGFSVPVGEWIFQKGNQLGPLVAAQSHIRDICNPDAVEKLFMRGGKREGKAAWTLLFYALWYRCHVRGERSQGDVFEALSG